MKITSTCLISLLLPFIALFSQQEQQNPYTEPVTKITFIEPGIAHEFPLGKSVTFFLRGGLTATTAVDYNDNFKGLLFRPFGAGSLRAYYNFAKRDLREKNTAKNSANYFAFLLIAATPPLNKDTNYDQDLNKTLINTGVVWGLQRNYPSNFSLDLNVGLGYVAAGNTSGLGLIGEFNIGWWLGKRYTSRK